MARGEVCPQPLWGLAERSYGDIGMGVQAELQYLLPRLLLKHVAFCSVPCWDLLKIRLPLVYLQICLS